MNYSDMYELKNWNLNSKKCDENKNGSIQYGWMVSNMELIFFKYNQKI